MFFCCHFLFFVCVCEHPCTSVKGLFENSEIAWKTNSPYAVQTFSSVPLVLCQLSRKKHLTILQCSNSLINISSGNCSGTIKAAILKTNELWIPSSSHSMHDRAQSNCKFLSVHMHQSRDKINPFTICIRWEVFKPGTRQWQKQKTVFRFYRFPFQYITHENLKFTSMFPIINMSNREWIILFQKMQIKKGRDSKLFVQGHIIIKFKIATRI